MGIQEVAVDIDLKVLQVVESAVPQARWVAVLFAIKRMQGKGQLVFSGMSQVIGVDDMGVLSHTSFSIPARSRSDLFHYFEDVFECDNWTRVTIRIDADGSRHAVAEIDPAGLPESEYIGAVSDPFWSYLDGHRVELEELARRHYGSPRSGLFRR